MIEDLVETIQNRREILCDESPSGCCVICEDHGGDGGHLESDGLRANELRAGLFHEVVEGLEKLVQILLKLGVAGGVFLVVYHPRCDDELEHVFQRLRWREKMIRTNDLLIWWLYL